MRTRLRGSRGLSEIVGTLMLVLIVVGAATALSVFIQTYQKQLQAQEAFTHSQNLEDLRIIEVAPVQDPVDPSQFSQLTFDIASETSENSTVTSMAVNAHPVFACNVTELTPSPGSPIPLLGSSDVSLAPHELLQVQLNFNSSNSSLSSFYDRGFVLLTSDYVKIELHTVYLNDFARALVPPTAVAVVTTIQTYTGSGYVTVLVLDASPSIQAGSNETLVAWHWVLTDTTAGTTQSFSGQKWALEGSYTYVPTDAYSASLTIVNSDGLLGSTTTTFI